MCVVRTEDIHRGELLCLFVPFGHVGWNRGENQHMFDDVREACCWLRQNTREDAVVMSWWDDGYQIARMGDESAGGVLGRVF